MTQAFPAFPQAPAFPPAGAYPPPAFPPPAAHPPMAAPAQPLAHGTLDDFFDQPAAGGKALVFDTPGDTRVGVVARAVTDGDVQQQTDTRGVPQTFRDGRPKFVMRVPLLVQPSADHPDGRAVWYVKGAVRDELARAMAEAGAPAGPPEAGAAVQIAFTGTRPSGPGLNPTKLFAVAYQRPATQPSPSPAAVPPPAPALAPAPAAPPATAPQPPDDLTPEQRALLARITGNPAA